MTDYGPLWNELIIMEDIIFFTLMGYLIYLIIETKLTHIEKFRKNFLSGIVLLLICAASFAVTTHYLTLEQNFLNLLNISILIALVISSLLIIFGLFKLDEYLYSIIGVEKKTSKIVILIISIPGPVVVYILTLITRIDYSGIIVTHAMLFLYIIYYFIFIYTFYIHKEMKDININMMAFFGTGFMFQVINQIMGIFIEALTDGLYYTLFSLWYVLLIIFIIAGYLNFKNRIKNVRK